MSPRARYIAVMALRAADMLLRAGIIFLVFLGLAIGLLAVVQVGRALAALGWPA